MRLDNLIEFMGMSTKILFSLKGYSSNLVLHLNNGE